MTEELRAHLRLAAPLVGAQCAAIGMGAVDTLYAGRLGADVQAAVALAVNLYTVGLLFVMGLFIATSAITAQLAGAGSDPATIRAFLRRSRRAAVVTGLVWWVLLAGIGPLLLRRLPLPGPVADEAVRFLQALAPSAVPTALWFALRFGAEGLGHSSSVLRAGLWGFVANAAFGYPLAFGIGDASGLGSIGLGIASTAATGVRVAVLLRADRTLPMPQPVASAPPVTAVTSVGVTQLLKLGLPIAVIVVADGGLFMLMTWLAAPFGAQSVAAVQIALSVVSLLFMVPMGVGLATAVRVAHAVGAGAPAAARRSAQVGIGLGLATGAANALLMVLAREPIARAYSDDPTVVRLAAGAIGFAAMFQLFDAIQTTAAGALRGWHDTRLPMLILLPAYWLIGLPLALLLSWQIGLAGIGWALNLALLLAASGLLLRLRPRLGNSGHPAGADA